MTEEEQIIINDITKRAADRINELETVNASLREEIERLKNLIKSDSVNTLLRFGYKSPSSSGVDDCEEERLYIDLYHISQQLRQPLPPKP
jgi:hypothetical protein